MKKGTTAFNREIKTIRAMLGIFCRDKHGSGILCTECTELFDYVLLRLEKCTFGENKPTCAKCPVHCYKPEMRARIIAVMRYAGPRLIRKHPLLTLMHLVRGVMGTGSGGRKK